VYLTHDQAFEARKLALSLAVDSHGSGALEGMANDVVLTTAGRYMQFLEGSLNDGQ
jgi:hypothetical protein